MLGALNPPSTRVECREERRDESRRRRHECPRHVSLGVDHLMDTIVIGAGIIGLSIAWRLAQRGLRVTLIDAGKAGGEASWAGAGMLAPGGEVTESTDWSRFALHSFSLYPGFVDEL